MRKIYETFLTYCRNKIIILSNSLIIKIKSKSWLESSIRDFCFEIEEICCEDDIKKDGKGSAGFKGQKY